MDVTAYIISCYSPEEVVLQNKVFDEYKNLAEVMLDECARLMKNIYSFSVDSS